jgi:hypothetical protein
LYCVLVFWNVSQVSITEILMANAKIIFGGRVIFTKNDPKIRG